MDSMMARSRSSTSSVTRLRHIDIDADADGASGLRHTNYISESHSSQDELSNLDKLSHRGKMALDESWFYLLSYEITPAAAAAGSAGLLRLCL